MWSIVKRIFNIPIIRQDELSKLHDFQGMLTKSKFPSSKNANDIRDIFRQTTATILKEAKKNCKNFLNFDISFGPIRFLHTYFPRLQVLSVSIQKKSICSDRLRFGFSQNECCRSFLLFSRMLLIAKRIIKHI